MDITTARNIYAQSFGGGGKMTYAELAEQYGYPTGETLRMELRRLGVTGRKTPSQRPFMGVAPSQMPVYDQPLQSEGDGAILFDVEAPFHNADFLNRVLELAYAWKIPTCILGGDVLHFDSFSHWEANWKQENKPGDNLTAETAEALRARIATLPEDQRQPFIDLLDKIPVDQPDNEELTESRRVLETIGQLFDRVDFVLGNHDARFLHALNTPLMPRKLLDFVGGMPENKWRIAPYYYSILVSDGETYRIEHPKSAAAMTAVKLADKYECSVLCGHSHLQSLQWSTSGKHYAIQAGCIVDEHRLAYASQRSTNRPAHRLGAVIVRGGVPWLLHDRTPWDVLKRM